MAELVYAVGSNPTVEKHVGSNPIRITVGLCGFRQIRHQHQIKSRIHNIERHIQQLLTFVSLQVRILSQAPSLM